MGHGDYPKGTRVWRGAVQDMIELNLFLDELKRLNAKKVLEIGTCGGGTAAAIASVAPHVVTMDIKKSDSQYPWEDEEYKKEFPHAKVKFVQADSRRFNTPGMVKDNYDVVFIDGEHYNLGGYTDFKRYGKMAPVVVVHDVNQWKTRRNDDWFPRNFFRLAVENGFKTKEILSKETNLKGLAGIGIVYLKNGDYEKLVKIFERYLMSTLDSELNAVIK